MESPYILKLWGIAVCNSSFHHCFWGLCCHSDHLQESCFSLWKSVGSSFFPTALYFHSNMCHSEVPAFTHRSRYLPHEPYQSENLCLSFLENLTEFFFDNFIPQVFLCLLSRTIIWRLSFLYFSHLHSTSFPFCFKEDFLSLNILALPLSFHLCYSNFQSSFLFSECSFLNNNLFLFHVYNIFSYLSEDIEIALCLFPPCIFCFLCSISSFWSLNFICKVFPADP